MLENTKLAILIKVILLIKLTFAGIILDSDGHQMDQLLSFRKNKCYNTANEQEQNFLKLTTPPKYLKYQRPGYNNGANKSGYPIYVNVSLDMNSLASIDDLNSEYNLILKMDLEWFDERLQFNCKDQLDLISLDPGRHERIWVPLLDVPDAKEPGSVQLDGHDSVMAFKIRSDGYVYIRSRFQLNLLCRMNFRNYPFDMQKCSVQLESRRDTEEQLMLQWREENPFRNSDRFQINGFSLIHYELKNESIQLIDLFQEEAVSRVIVILHFQREWHHFLLDVYLPSALFVVISWLSFWLEISAAPARVTLGMTTMLTLITNSMSSREKQPKVTYIHALDIWNAFCTCLVFASLIEFALVSYLYRYENNKRKKLKSLQREIYALSLASLASIPDPMVKVSQYLDVPEKNNCRDYLAVPKLADNLRRLSSESASTTSTASDLRHIEKCSDKRKNSFFRRLFNTKCPALLADEIDRRCRVLFPICFAIFNTLYWSFI